MTRLRTNPQIAVLPVLLMAYGLRLFRVAEQSFWWDEVHTVVSVNGSLQETFRILFEIRSHVPLYFVLMQSWAGSGSSEFVLRYFSVILGVVSVALIYGNGRFIGKHRTGWLAALLLTFSPFHIWYSQEARMYTLVTAAVIAAHYFLCRLIRRSNSLHWLGYSVSMITAVYTHYLCLLILLAHYTFFSLSYRHLKPLFLKWVFYGGLAGLLFGVWGVAIMSTGGFTNASISWIPAANWYTPLITLLSLGVGPTINPANPIFYVVLIVYLAAIAACFLAYRRAPLPQLLTLRVLLCWLFVPILLTYFISLDWPIPQKRSIYIDRYLILSLPALLLVVSWGITTVAQNGRWMQWAALALIAIPMGLSLNNLYFDPQYAREDWRAAINQLEATFSPNDVLLMDPSQPLPVSYYQSQPIPYEVVPFLFDEAEKETYEQEEMPLVMAEISEQWKRLWFISVVNNSNPHGFPQERNNTLAQIGQHNFYKSWLDGHYILIDEWVFSGIHLGLYDLSKPTK